MAHLGAGFVVHSPVLSVAPVSLLDTENDIRGQHAAKGGVCSQQVNLEVFPLAVIGVAYCVEDLEDGER